MADKFTKPLNQWVEEETPIQKRTFDPESRRFITTTEIQRTKTIYYDVPKVKLRCQAGTHVFKVLDKHKYLFKCINCPFIRKVYPTTYKFDEKTGFLTHILTGTRV